MKVTLEANGKKVEVEPTKEQMEQLGVSEEKQKWTRYEREFINCHYCVNEHFDVQNANWFPHDLRGKDQLPERLA